MTDKRETLELIFTDYMICGRATIELFDGCIGVIDMTEVHIPAVDEADIISNINDGGFGCKKILSADVDIFENYEGHLVYMESRSYNFD